MNFINFVKYNNAFTIGIAAILLVTGGVFASEDVRDNVIGETITTITGIDNTAMLALDAGNFDLKLTIQNVTEDENSYYISYTYMTMGIKDNVWQPMTIEKTLNVSKERLGDMDLGAYVSVQLGELADYELNRINEVQFIEENKGAQTQIASIAYTGLKGLVFDPKEKELPGYAPVVKDEKEDISGEFSPAREDNDGEYNAEPENPPTTTVVQVVRETVNRDELRQIIREMLADQPVPLDSSNSPEYSNVSEYSNSSDLSEASDSLIPLDSPVPSNESASSDSSDSFNFSESPDSLIPLDSPVPSNESASSDSSDSFNFSESPDSLIPPDPPVPSDAPVPPNESDQVQ